MKHSKNKRMTMMIFVLLGLLVVAYKVMFAPSVDEAFLVEDNIIAGERVVQILRQIENIDFDTSVLAEAKFISLKSIAVPPPSLPIGKQNPFSIISN